jgi:alginate O-acetyltransferase complex protein AlgI
MSFASFEFVVFFLVVTALYFLLPHRLRWIQLLVASSIFYMYFIPRYILILFFTIAVDYAAGILIEGASGPRRRRYLWLSLTANIGVLAVFKYANFAIENVNVLAPMLGVPRSLPALNFILPIGLSFHTFQAMSYTIEVYRGNQRAERHLGIYALYVMFYPQLIAGPIERPGNMLHQFHEEKALDRDRVVSGLRLMLWGFFKKLVIADRMAVIVDAVYLQRGAASGSLTLVALACFTLQLYGDFSGYSDIALGSARVMGFELMKNFDAPLFSTSLTEFWRRWHISLSTWFNDYLFTPLYTALRRWDRAGLAFALMVTFLLSGLWHGAAWTFVIYGGIHGVVLVYEALTRKTRKRWVKRLGAPLYDRLTWLTTLTFVTFALAFFRAPTLRDAVTMITHAAAVQAPGYFHLGVVPGVAPWKFALSFVPVALLVLIEARNREGRLTQALERQPLPVRWGFYYAAVAGVLVFGAFGTKQFIYFQF